MRAQREMVGTPKQLEVPIPLLPGLPLLGQLTGLQKDPLGVFLRSAALGDVSSFRVANRTVVGEDSLNLYYLLEWKDLAERERIWPAFMTDPEWIKARTESEKNGPILAQATNTILAPTAFSRMK